MMESTQSPFDIDETINLCTEEIYPSSSIATSLSHDVYAFQSACLDTGAQLSVISKRQVPAYCKQHNIRYTLKPLFTKFKLGDGVFLSIGTMQIRITTRNYSFLKIKLNVVLAEIPLLLDLDVLGNEKSWQAMSTSWLVDSSHA